MAGVAGRSGGHNAVSIEEHRRRGTYRPARHAGRTDPAPPVPVSAADRRRTLLGLPPEAQRIAGRLLDGFAGWDAARLAVLRMFALSCQRIVELEADPAPDVRQLHREVRINLQLLKSLDLEAD